MTDRFKTEEPLSPIGATKVFTLTLELDSAGQVRLTGGMPELSAALDDTNRETVARALYDNVTNNGN